MARKCKECSIETRDNSCHWWNPFCRIKKRIEAKKG